MNCVSMNCVVGRSHHVCSHIMQIRAKNDQQIQAANGGSFFTSETRGSNQIYDQRIKRNTRVI